MKIAVWGLHPITFSPQLVLMFWILSSWERGFVGLRFQLQMFLTGHRPSLPSIPGWWFTLHTKKMFEALWHVLGFKWEEHPPIYEWKNFSLNAAWRMTRLDHQGYLDHECGNVSPYASIEGFNVETVAYDLLHNVFLGVGRDLFASGLKLLISKGVWTDLGDDMDTILSGIHSEMHRTCGSLGFLCLSIVPF